MVLFMDVPDTQKGSDGDSHEQGVKQPATDQNAKILQSLPFSVDRSFLYSIDDFQLTLLASGFFGDIFQVITKYFRSYLSV